MKPFQTHRQQIAILRGRGLSIPDGSKALRILEQENYYGVINGYKDFFLQRDQNNRIIVPDAYKVGATFEEIYTLYSFDRDLRNILLEYLLKFETSVKSKISYRFSERYKESHAYLILKNYSRDPQKLKDVLSLIATISNTISKKGKNSSNPIGHYLDKHDGVPLWVLVNYLTLGNMQYFYTCLTDPLQNAIAKDFAISYKRDYGTPVQLTANILENVLKTVTFFRNVCAHEERLFSFRLYRPARSGNIATILGIPNQELNKGNVFAVVSFLKLVLPKKEHKALLRKLKHLFNDHSNKF
ncbi:Abi family protein, partial [Shigella flexneri]|nr:Abi family protein [Shigella flexneri]